MRLKSLELEKYGAFESLRLRFRCDAKLHVVYGPNEAGKSTALAAIGALLYGVAERTPFAFRYPGQELRIGAEIVGRDGTERVVRRRKGRKNTLQLEDGAVLPDDALDLVLGGVGEDAFRRSFGLELRSLARGRRRDAQGGRRRWGDPARSGVRPAQSSRVAQWARSRGGRNLRRAEGLPPAVLPSARTAWRGAQGDRCEGAQGRRLASPQRRHRSPHLEDRNRSAWTAGRTRPSGRGSRGSSARRRS